MYTNVHLVNAGMVCSVDCNEHFSSCQEKFPNLANIVDGVGGEEPEQDRFGACPVEAGEFYLRFQRVNQDICSVFVLE